MLERTSQEPGGSPPPNPMQPSDLTGLESRSPHELVDEIRRLRAELQQRKDEELAITERTRRVRSYIGSVGLKTFVGSDFYQKCVDAWDAWSTWLRSGTSEPWPEPQTRNFTAALLARLTRIGVVFLALTGLPLLITVVQFIVLSRQNVLIETQTQLAESARRSALVFELSGILDEIDEELDQISASPSAEDSIEPRLSPRLEGRIIALSRSFRPYRYLDGSHLTDEPRSPERGQLLAALANSQIDLSAIMFQANFSFADLAGTTLEDVDLGHSGDVNASSSFAGANFAHSYLESVSFQGQPLMASNFRLSRMVSVKFVGSNLRSADFSNARLINTDFTEASVHEADFSGADLLNVTFDEKGIFGVRFNGATLRSVKFLPISQSVSEIPELVNQIADQLCKAQIIYDSGMSSAVLNRMKKDEACRRKLVQPRIQG